MKHRTNRIPAAFTLIEMLTVIAIIAILAGLLFPAIKSALQKAEIAQAQNDIKTIETALRMFYTDYGKWPNGNGGTLQFSYGAFAAPYLQHHPGAPGQSGYCENHWLMDTLQGIQDTSTLCGNGGSLSGGPINTRNTSYLTIPAKSLKLSTDNTGLDFVDPWKNPYQITVDTDYSNNCYNLAFGSANSGVYTPVGTGSVGMVSNNTIAVWSFGPLGPYAPHTAKDWITSWQ